MKRIWSTLGSYVLIAAVAGWAQETRKAGLWVVATTTKIQQAGETAGNFVARSSSGSPSSAEGGVPECLTQDVVDSYGVILPPSLKDCELSNVVQTASSFKADMTCKGGYNGFGSLESKWTDADHVTGKVRFVSRTKESKDGRELIWSQESSAVFKSAECGAVKPRRKPAGGQESGK
jgi:hypothetical protein